MHFPTLRVVFLTALLLYLALQLFLLRRINHYVSLRFPKHGKLLLVVATVFFLFTLYPLFWRVIFGWGSYEPSPEALRSLVGFWAFGSAGLALLLLGYELFKRAANIFSFPQRSVDLERREFLKKGTGAVFAAPFVISGYSVFLGRERFQIEHFDLSIKGLSNSLNQLTIVQLTDIHAGPFMAQEELAAYVEAANRLKPDLIALTGDFVSFQLEEVAPCIAALGQLKARYGIYACLGNHDFYARAEEELVSGFEARGVQTLRNSGTTISIGSSAVSVLGIDDLRSGRPSLSRALKATRDAPAEIRLLLSHRPEIFPFAARNGIDIILAGHYHGGQIKLFPSSDSLSIARFMTRYAEGLFYLPRSAGGSRVQAPDSVLFVSRGIGTTGLPVRVNCPPQIAHLTLKRI